MTDDRTEEGVVGTVTAFPTVEDYWGVCPICGRNNGFISIGRDHWVVCHTHRTKWCVGSNLFSGWRELSEEDHRRNYYRLATYREIKPRTPRRHRILAAYERALADYGGGAIYDVSVDQVVAFMDADYTADEVKDALAWAAAERRRKADAGWRARQEDPQGRLPF